MTSQDPSVRQLDFVFEEALPLRRVWPVGELVLHARELMEREFVDVWVEGEISNLRPAPSGHVYFTLKDGAGQLPVVLFRRQALLLRFRPDDGLHVLARGRMSVYEQRGQLQLIAESLEPVGAGSLQLAFEQLKEKLRAEGLFEIARKKPLPAFPRTVAIVTSPTGAVVRDFLNIVRRRHSGLNVMLYPVSVQGESAPAEIEAALAQLNVASLIDVIVLARGGGSLEDLAAFNSERVARAISTSRLPVVSAVGHETDFTIADFVADLRAPTPSAAAELITEAQHRISDRLDNLAQRLERAARYELLRARQQVQSLQAERAEWRIAALVQRLGQRFDDVQGRLEIAMGAKLREQRGVADALAGAVARHDPRRLLAESRERMNHGRMHLDRCAERILHGVATRLHALEARLHALSPLAVLDRGYALVQNLDGVLMRSIEQIAPGDQVRTRLSNGSFTSRVDATSAAAARTKNQTKEK